MSPLSLRSDLPGASMNFGCLEKNMKPFAAVLALALTSAVFVPVAGAGPGSAGHSHDETAYAAGEPGDGRKPARVVLVTMGEADGKMSFIPDRIQVRTGEQVRFILKNNGEIDHEFVLATPEENLKHAEAMRKNPDMEHDDPNAKRIAPRGTVEIVWRFNRSGKFEFACLIPGHREAGMIGKVDVN